MRFRQFIIFGLLLATNLASPRLAAAQAVPEVTLETPQLEYTRPSRAVLARRRAGWVMFAGALPTFLVGFGVTRYILRRNGEDSTGELALIGETIIAAAIGGGLFFTGMGLLLRSRRFLGRERGRSRHRLAYDLDIGPLGGALTVSF